MFENESALLPTLRGTEAELLVAAIASPEAEQAAVTEALGRLAEGQDKEMATKVVAWHEAHQSGSESI